MNGKLLNGSKETDYGIAFPPTWSQSSKQWAVRTALPQTVVDELEARLVEFRRKRDNHRAGIFTVGKAA